MRRSIWCTSPGRGPAPLPLLLTHGWPGSFCEYLDLLPLLTDPGGHGGDPGDAFTVVAPSLPGFGRTASGKHLVTTTRQATHPDGGKVRRPGSPPASGIGAERAAGARQRVLTPIASVIAVPGHHRDAGCGQADFG